jgi:hypothetical protein
MNPLESDRFTHIAPRSRHVRGLTVVVLGLALLAAACGGEEAGTAGGALQTRAQEIVQCLQDAGLDAALDPSTAFGVEAPHQQVKVPIRSVLDNEFPARLWVFETPEAAEEARPLITLGETEDSEKNRLIDTVLVSYGSIPNEDDAATVEGCA